jgi:Uma2 family endonuclease
MAPSPLVQNIHVSNSPKRNPTIADLNFRKGLPTADELPDSDGKPVDSELQELIPGLLKSILLDQWRDRSNWLFGIDLGFYYDPDQPCIAPDGLLCLGIRDAIDENLRSSYVLWDEMVIPSLALEVVSKAYGKEHSKKLEVYRTIGILYYVVYAPLRKRKTKFQLYKLVNGDYVLQSEGETPYWMPEIQLGIGVEQGRYGHSDRQWLYWYDEMGQRLWTPTERADVAMERADAAEQKNQRLLAKLQELGIDPDSI